MIQKNSDAFNSFIKNYWRYYRELEKEFLSTTRYVEVAEDNFSTYSIEFLKLYQAACSEIDVVGKMMASKQSPSFKIEDTKNNILKWWYEIQDTFIFTDEYSDAVKEGKSTERKHLSEVKCTFLDSYKICPWNQFRTEIAISKKGSHYYKVKEGHETPSFWLDYNSVKHNRTSVVDVNSPKINYSKANLKNVSYAFSALYVLETVFMEAIGTQNDLEAFADYSELFVKTENTTTEDITEMWKKII